MSVLLAGLEETSRLFRALGDETRLRIVALLAHGELCVCHVHEALGISQPNASQQLAVLRAAGVVTSRRAGGWVYYRLARQEDPLRERQLKALVTAFGRDDMLKRDVERLLRTRGPGACVPRSSSRVNP
jgi:ArsR family transcriptional regulator, arsenate/arsenite/antimonite-responsive transcriptional repressor